MVDAVRLIEATLAPIFLVTGAALFLAFTQARLFRVVDRLRRIAATVPKDETHRKVLLMHQTRDIRRAMTLRNATMFGILVIAFTVATILLLLFGGATLDAPLGTAAVVAFTLSLVSFAVALVLVTVDSFLSVNFVAREGVDAELFPDD